MPSLAQSVTNSQSLLMKELLMKRTLIIVLLLSVLAFTSFSSISDAQRGRGRVRRAAPAATQATGGKVNIPCPATLNDITDCPDTGCGLLDPNLNLRKNVRTDNQAAEAMTIQDLKDLPDPVPDFTIGDAREKLTALGEGKKITVMAKALVARKGSQESCNCKLAKVADTDNHIVLVDPSVRRPTLAANENDSETAEFTPRVRLDHPNLGRPKLQPLITAAGGALLVRVTGLLMFDSEHSLGLSPKET